MRSTGGLVKDYALLTAEERFRLILAASGRGDEAERDRLGRAGGRLTLVFQDHAPFAHALNELSHLTFLELAEDARFYADVSASTDDIADALGGRADREEGEGGADDVEVGPVDAPGGEARAGGAGGGQGLARERGLDVVLAAGYVLKAKAAGWTLFCSRLGVPSFLLWEPLPGCGRLRRALDLAEAAAFTAEGMLGWLSRTRPEGTPAPGRVALTSEAVADATEEAFRARARWWGG